jgi:hypothetical protein
VFVPCDRFCSHQSRCVEGWLSNASLSRKLETDSQAVQAIDFNAEANYTEWQREIEHRAWKYMMAAGHHVGRMTTRVVVDHHSPRWPGLDQWGVNTNSINELNDEPLAMVEDVCQGVS